MAIPQKPYNIYYINNIADLPASLLDNSIYQLTTQIDIGAGSIDIPLNTQLISLTSQAEIISTNTNPITGIDWKLRVKGVKINGVLEGRVGGHFASAKSIDLFTFTTMQEGETVWVEDQLLWGVYKGGKWVDLTTGTEILAILFEEKWDSGDFLTNGWQVANDTINQWIVGSADKYEGNFSAYISNDGINPQYDVNTPNISHIWIDITFPAIATYNELRMFWKGEMEFNFDYGRLYMAPITVMPAAGVLVSSTYQIGKSQYNNQSTFVNEIINLGDLSGQTKRFIWSFRNDGSIGAFPSWIVDKIQFLYKPV